jgi:hypothetical protein
MVRYLAGLVGMISGCITARSSHCSAARKSAGSLRRARQPRRIQRQGGAVQALKLSLQEVCCAIGPPVSVATTARLPFAAGLLRELPVIKG